MTKATLIIILLFASIAHSKQYYQLQQDLLLAELNTTQVKIRQEMLEWKHQFNLSLIEDEDPNIRLLGYVMPNPNLHWAKENISFVDLSLELNSMIALDTFSDKTIV